MPKRTAESMLRPANDGDREFVRELSARVFARFGNYAALLPPLVGSPWVKTTVAIEAGAPVGFAMLSLDDLEAREVDLVAIAVCPERQRRGVATRLLQQVEAEVRGLAAGNELILRLTVAEDNRSARELFRRAGFVRTPDRRGVYSGGQRSLGMHRIVR